MLAGRRHGQIALLELGRVGAVGLEELIGNAHGASSFHLDD
jgi:hypothetical protein